MKDSEFMRRIGLHSPNTNSSSPILAVDISFIAGKVSSVIHAFPWHK